MSIFKESLTDESAFFFHRLDDVGEKDLAVLKFLEWAENDNVECIIAVIPFSLSRDVTELLRKSRNLIVFQHGVSHVNKVTTGYPDEFPGHIPEFEVRDLIHKGKKLLEDNLGQQIEGYVPPWNKTSSQTLRVLEDLEFTMFSGHSKFSHLTTLKQFNVNIDTASSYLPLRLRTPLSVLQEVNNEFDRRNSIGIMYHVNNLSEEKIKPLRKILNYKFTMVSSQFEHGDF